MLLLRGKTESKMSTEQRNEQSECYKNIAQTSESLLHYDVTLQENAQVCMRPSIYNPSDILTA